MAFRPPLPPTERVNQVEVLRLLVDELSSKIESSQRRVADEVRDQVRAELGASIMAAVEPLSDKIDDLSANVTLVGNAEKALANEVSEIKRWTQEHDSVHAAIASRDVDDQGLGRLVRRQAIVFIAALSVALSIAISVGMVLASILGHALGIR